MATFPALKPSSRIFSPGEYPNTAFRAWSGVESRVRHSNVMLESTVRLSFLGLSEADMLSILAHYNGQKGNFLSFDLPADIWAGVSNVNDYTLSGYNWRYAEPPVVSDLPCGGHDVDLTLASVPFEGATIGGMNQTVQLSLSGGVAAGMNSTDGASLTITASFTGGAFSTDSASTTGLDLAVTASLAAGAASTAITDPDFSNVSLLLHMDGSNGSTTFTDSSSLNRTVTKTGSGVISTGVSAKFGSASYFSNTLNDKLTVSGTETIGTGDFTCEFWWYPLVFSDGYKVFFRIENTTTGVKWGFTSNDDGTARKLFFFKEVPGDFYYITSGTAGLTIATNTWKHVAVTRSGSTLRTFYDGVLHQTGTLSDDISGNLILLWHASNSGSSLGYVDDFRLTKTARYTSNFTPPTAPFPDA